MSFNPQRIGRREAWLLAACMAGAALLRVLVLEQQPLWYDEIATLYRASAPDLPELLARLAADVQAPLYDLLMLPLVARFGDGVWVARLPPLVASVLLLPAVAALVGELGGGRGARLTAAAWVGLDGYLIRYGVEGRPYSLLALLACGLVWAALRCVRREGRGAWQLAAWGMPLVMLHPYGVPLMLAVALWLACNGSALRGRAGALLGALLLPLLALLAWSPLALHQLATKSMGDIYSGVSPRQLVVLWDGVTLAAPRAIGVSGDSAWILAGRVVTLLLALLGLFGCRAAWRAANRTQAAQPASTARAPAASRPVRAALAVGALALAALSLSVLLPEQSLADLASRLAKAGRPLDEKNLAFLRTLRGFGRLAGAGLLLASAALFWVPRWAPRWGGRPSPVTLVLLVLALPLGLAAAMGAAGHPTFAPRNAIGLLPVAIALVALGLWRLPRPLGLVMAGLLLAQALWGWGALERFHRRQAWPELCELLTASAATPLAHPPWLARCVEYHAGLPWRSVVGLRRPALVAAWAARQRSVALVTGYEHLDDPAPVRAALAGLMRGAEPVRVRGLSLQVFTAEHPEHPEHPERR